MLEAGLTFGEVDSVTGTLIGRPKSATFRTLDVVGLDTFIHVANNAYNKVAHNEKDIFVVPTFMEKMYEKGWLGAKTNKGFYLKEKGEEGSIILQLNPDTFEFEKRQKLKTNAIEIAQQQKGLKRRVKALVSQPGDKASDFLWNVLKQSLLYSAECLGEIADDIVSIDQAMKWGFGWRLGPFELWDAIGVEESVERMEAEGTIIPHWVKEFLEAGHETFYKE